jgi:predicted transcriptional regulator of viral defense system
MVENELLNKSDIVWDYFVKHPHKQITPKKLAEILKINYNTVNSAINRYYISGKIKKMDRGTYVLLPPLSRGQTTLGEGIQGKIK